MGEARSRRFPPVSGPYGWAGAAFVLAGLASQMGAGLFLFLLVLNRDGRFVIPLLICFFLALPLLGAALVLWRTGMKRAGTLRPSSMAKERQRQIFGTLAVMNLGTVLGIGAFVYLALRLDGTRRFVFAMVPIFFAAVVSHLGLLKLRQLQNRPAPRILGLAPRNEAILFVAFSLISALILVVTGLFWMPN
ncbi:MAG: hypothetical protein E6I86_16805 [Chloroflexi bacterium]|nr:MAG: hypothetical protein E6I86_16805 [Chloroflexota bacterium]